MAAHGAVIAIEIKWDCNLDLDFMTYCLPKYDFHILDDTGWNFRHAIYHEENRRTLIKAYGIRFLVNVNGIAGKFDITKTTVIIITGLGLMGLANIMCECVLLQSSNRYREQIEKKKFETVELISSKREGKRKSLLRRMTMAVIESKVQSLGESDDSSSPAIIITTNTPPITPAKSQNNVEYISQLDTLIAAL